MHIYFTEQSFETPEFLEKLDNGLLVLNASNNNVLHLVSKIAHVKNILENDPSHIHCRNSDTETPAYVAAREGRVDILRFMIDFVKRMNEDVESIITRIKDNHNALHIAIQNHHIEVIFLLIEEIPQLANRMNEFKESPLYLAAERGYFGVVELILKKCKEISFEGRNGKSALHAAVISDSGGEEYILSVGIISRKQVK
ncbi:hypothetical protein L1987_38101 [Smallanthus sonchifolius]|uniref:Uncharacterized protein n=1 Tax=Smallanthus sonchifolius TaxID=185202 RepID=A0ACB9HJJ6_9ASTR|nr:hypothetical protein L1987_38101 [Smallanthus sonchifolius]